MVNLQIRSIAIVSISIFVLQIDFAFGQSTPSTTTTTTQSPQWIDPYSGGKYGKPGARVHLSNKSIDAINSYAAEAVARSIQSMSIPDLFMPVGAGTLTIRSPRITESKFANVENQLWSPNRIRSRFYNGRFVASGQWQFKPYSLQRSAQGGSYRTTIVNGELNSTNQLSRTNDAKPNCQTTECKANLGQFRIEIEGAGNTTTIDSCDNPICIRIRSYFEDVFCAVMRTFVKDVVNRKLATFPARINIDADHVLEYGLLYNEPRVDEDDMQAGLEGKVSCAGMGSFGFYPPELQMVEKNRMVTLEMSDYTFNTMLQTHFQKYRLSAFDLLSPTYHDLLRLNCTSSDKVDLRLRKLPKGGKWGGGISSSTTIGGTRSLPCLGSIFDNSTNFGQFASNDTGDLIFKSGQRSPSIFVQSKQFGFFDASNSVLEIYGPAQDQQGRRQLLARADVRLLRGDFMAKLNGFNITGAINVTTLQLGQSSPQSRSIGDQWLIKLAQFAKPILTEIFNSMFKHLAQFPVPMLDGFECTSPEFSISTRTMQVDCDVRSVPRRT